MLKAFGNRVLVEPIPEPEATPGGIIKPQTARARHQTMEGFVRSVGRGYETQKGVIVPPDLAEGQKVLFKRTYGEICWENDGTELRNLALEDIVAVVVD
jgi:chaperonin GroES